MINMIVDCCSCCHEDAVLCPNKSADTYEVEVMAREVTEDAAGPARAAS